MSALYDNYGQNLLFGLRRCKWNVIIDNRHLGQKNRPD